MAAMTEDLDEFVNWDQAGASVGTGTATGLSPSLLDISQSPPTNDIDLVLANVQDDDFSFFALQHFSGEPDPGLHLAADSFDAVPQLWWQNPAAPCVSCRKSAFDCKMISEGQHKGYCTSCVALKCKCSLADAQPASLALDSSSNPFAQSWPSIGEQQQPEQQLARSGATGDMAPVSPALPAPKATPPPPKIGARFSRDSVRVLKNWLSTHNRHPYPSDEEKEMLQRQTGLNKTQITNWLANARRRGKIQPPRSTSPHVRSSYSSGPIDIPRRSGTPTVESMNPLQRWVDSPPEHEPASVTAIARAVASTGGTSSSGLNSPHSYNFTDDGSGRSLCNASSASSVGTSHSSGGSFASAFSHASRNSLGSFGSLNRGRRRRRRRAAPQQGEEKRALQAPLKTFQCTFCTETFRTKHDWQRHEKSLHLSLERWVCAPDGPRAANPDTGVASCVFCGEANPDDAHVESHNHSACQERSLEERTFYRKDHLNQHMKLVHNVKFLDWTMKPWKVATPEIRSRCGFCGIVMDTWTIRVDHLAEHFKTGNTMADWKGDWGFEAPVLDMVENSIPPYLIENERNSPLPFIAGVSSPESPRSAYELIKMELAFFMQNHEEKTGSLPSDEQMQLEACRIIFASEVLSLQGISSTFSWLRDLIMSSDALAKQAKFGPMRSAIENRLSILKINGKDNLFEACPLESQLHEFVKARRLLGLTAMDDELQEEACCTVGRIEEVSTAPSDFIANWLVRLINSSTSWLANFRQRAHLPRTEDIMNAHQRSTDSSKIDSTIHNYTRLERELGEYYDAQRAVGSEPTDSDLQRQARIIIYEFDDGWNQTAADNPKWLAAFKERHLERLVMDSASTGSSGAHRHCATSFSAFSTSEPSPSLTSAPSTAPSKRLPRQDPLPRAERFTTGPFFLNDANCYRRLARELTRYVHAAMSANNPNQHVPSDDELQHQARWILYDDDDPWNQTAADNAEWLQRFKRESGIIKETGPGLPEGDSWSVEQGGTGFAPPYLFPKSQIAPLPDQVDKVEVSLRHGAKTFETDPALLNKYLETFKTRYPKPAMVFCSRELERELSGFVQKELAEKGVFPSDEMLQKQAREILKMPMTAADDPVLLEKFKDWMRGQEIAETEQQPSMLDDIDMNITDAEMNNILQEMNLDLELQTQLLGDTDMAEMAELVGDFA